MLPVVSSFLAVLFISLISIVLIYFLISRIPVFAKYSLSLVGIAVGSLLGDAFIHVLPEANRQINNDLLVSLLTILGILLFFSLEKFVRWRHCHDPDCDQDTGSHIVPISLVGEAFHNFIDGVIITASFITSPALGLATSLAVLLHEIPQEIGHFSIYIHQGVSLIKSLYLNLFAAIFAFAGVVFTVLIGSSITNFSAYILPITAGGFIYLASSDLIPELHRHQASTRSSLSQIFLVILGVAIMSSLLLLE
jgi:zinc and cadmium transporter